MGPLSFVCLPEFGKISNSKESQIHLMAKFVAGKNDEDSRNPIALSAVLDVSGSMAGTKIETLKKVQNEMRNIMLKGFENTKDDDKESDPDIGKI